MTKAASLAALPVQLLQVAESLSNRLRQDAEDNLPTDAAHYL